MAPRAELIRAEYGKADHFPERGVMKRSVLFFVFFFSFSLSPLLLHAEDRGGAPAPSGIGQEPAFAPMPGPGKKVSIGSGYSFEKESDAKQFMKEHKGRRLLKFQEITPKVIRSLDNP
jgi:hypothetical protein